MGRREVEDAEIVDETLPQCGICDQHKDCANCIDAYGHNIDCGWPICRECRDEGPPEGNEMPERSWDRIFSEGIDPIALTMRRLHNAQEGTNGR